MHRTRRPKIHPHQVRTLNVRSRSTAAICISGILRSLWISVLRCKRRSKSGRTKSRGCRTTIKPRLRCRTLRNNQRIVCREHKESIDIRSTTRILGIAKFHAKNPCVGETDRYSKRIYRCRIVPATQNRISVPRSQRSPSEAYVSWCCGRRRGLMADISRRAGHIRSPSGGIDSEEKSIALGNCKRHRHSRYRNTNLSPLDELEYIVGHSRIWIRESPVHHDTCGSNRLQIHWPTTKGSLSIRIVIPHRGRKTMGYKVRSNWSIGVEIDRIPETTKFQTEHISAVSGIRSIKESRRPTFVFYLSPSTGCSYP